MPEFDYKKLLPENKAAAGLGMFSMPNITDFAKESLTTAAAQPKFKAPGTIADSIPGNSSLSVPITAEDFLNYPMGGDKAPAGSSIWDSASKGLGEGYDFLSGKQFGQFGKNMLGLGQLGLGVAGYLEGKKTAKQQRALNAQQLAANKLLYDKQVARDAQIAESQKKRQAANTLGTSL